MHGKSLLVLGLFYIFVGVVVYRIFFASPQGEQPVSRELASPPASSSAETAQTTQLLLQRTEHFNKPQIASATSTCLSCHEGQIIPSEGHDVSCSACHLGNERSLDKQLSHLGVIPRPGRSPQTTKVCAQCHQSVSAALQNSMIGLLPGKALSPACNQCHAVASKTRPIREIACGECHLPPPTGQKSQRHQFYAKVPSERCLACHAFHQLPKRYDWSEGKPPTFRPDSQTLLASDPHLSAGLECSDCHRSAHHGGKPAANSCNSCHQTLQQSKKLQPEVVQILYHAKHAGKLTCVSCHLGASVDGLHYSWLDQGMGESVAITRILLASRPKEQLLRPVQSTLLDREGQGVIYLHGIRDCAVGTGGALRNCFACHGESKTILALEETPQTLSPFLSRLKNERDQILALMGAREQRNILVRLAIAGRNQDSPPQVSANKTFYDALLPYYRQLRLWWEQSQATHRNGEAKER